MRAIDRVVAEGVGVAAHGFLGDLGEADALDLVAVPVKYFRRTRFRPTASKICAPQ
jgi:hypothetical protein